MTTSPSDLPIIRIGTAGWSYDDWNGVVYPATGRRLDPLEYLAHYFDTIEINSPFYRIPPESHARSWTRRVRTNPSFRFTTKVYRGFTHESKFPSAEDIAGFKAYLDRLAEEDRLGALLLQFPWSFKDGEPARARLRQLNEIFAPYPRALEVRHASFQNAAFQRWLLEEGISLVNIDQPLFHDSVKPEAVVTGPVGYVRFHGRNYGKWFQHEESWERYDYLYSPKELAPWVERIRSMEAAREIYVITNNHFRGQAAVNALELKQMLGQKVEVPGPLRAAYSERFSA